MFFYRTCLYILFDKVLQKKQAFLELKNVLLQKSKNLHFRKMATLGQKFEINCMCNFPLNRKTQAFLELKNVLLQKSKNLHFCKGVTLGQKFEIYLRV